MILGYPHFRKPPFKLWLWRKHVSPWISSSRNKDVVVKSADADVSSSTFSHFEQKQDADVPSKFLDGLWMWSQLQIFVWFQAWMWTVVCGIGRGPYCMLTTTAPICTPRTLSVVQTSMPWCHGGANLDFWHLFCEVLYSDWVRNWITQPTVAVTTKTWLLSALLSDVAEVTSINHSLVQIALV